MYHPPRPSYQKFDVTIGKSAIDGLGCFAARWACTRMRSGICVISRVPQALRHGDAKSSSRARGNRRLRGGLAQALCQAWSCAPEGGAILAQAWQL